MAGVVNIITKRHLKGLAGRAEAGISELGDALSYRLSLTGGVGDLDTDRYNVYVTFDLKASVKVNDKFTIYANMLYLFNRYPPLDNVTYEAHLYNPVQGGSGILGRHLKAGVKFGPNRQQIDCYIGGVGFHAAFFDHVVARANFPSPSSTLTVEPSGTSPRRIASASGSCRYFCTARFSGRAP